MADEEILNQVIRQSQVSHSLIQVAEENLKNKSVGHLK